MSGMVWQKSDSEWCERVLAVWKFWGMRNFWQLTCQTCQMVPDWCSFPDASPIESGGHQNNRVIFYYYWLHFPFFLTHIIVMAASSINGSGLQDLWPLCLLKVVGIKIIKSFLIITDFIFIFFFLPNSYYCYGSFILCFKFLLYAYLLMKVGFGTFALWDCWWFKFFLSCGY